MILLNSLFLVALLMNSVFAESRILTDWTVEMEPPQNATEQVSAFFMGGLSGNEESFFTSDRRSLVVGRSVRTGEVIWRSLEDSSSQSHWTASEDSLFGGDNKGIVYRIRKNDGTTVWKAKSKGFFVAAPLVDSQRVYLLNSLGNLEVFSRETGEWLWQSGTSGEAASVLSGAVSALAFGSQIVAGFPNGTLQAFDATSGSKIWSSSFIGSGDDAGGVNDVRSLRVFGDKLAAASYAGSLRLWRALGGSQRLVWEKKISSAQPVEFSSDGLVIYVSDRQGRLSALDSETGFLRWEKSFSAPLNAVAVSPSGNLWAGTGSGEVLVIDTQGALIARRLDVARAFYSQFLALNDGSVLTVSDRGVLRRLRLTSVRPG
jgi:outer membrane protein assembly factor BamB